MHVCDAGYETVYEGCEREHQFEQLTPGHQYRVRVACCSAGGRSDVSDIQDNGNRDDDAAVDDDRGDDNEYIVLGG